MHGPKADRLNWCIKILNVPWLWYWGQYAEAKFSQSWTRFIFSTAASLVLDTRGAKGPKSITFELCLGFCFTSLPSYSCSKSTSLSCICTLVSLFDLQPTTESVLFFFELWFVISDPNSLFFGSFRSEAVSNPLLSFPFNPNHLYAGFPLSKWRICESFRKSREGMRRN